MEKRLIRILKSSYYLNIINIIILKIKYAKKFIYKNNLFYFYFIKQYGTCSNFNIVHVIVNIIIIIMYNIVVYNIHL